MRRELTRAERRVKLEEHDADQRALEADLADVVGKSMARIVADLRRRVGAGALTAERIASMKLSPALVNCLRLGIEATLLRAYARGRRGAEDEVAKAKSTPLVAGVRVE